MKDIGSVEYRIIDPDTGGEKGTKLERYDLIPVTPLASIARHYGVGARKYTDRNWERGYLWSLSFAAMMRHAWAFWGGEDIDVETGSPHLAAVVFHAVALMEYGQTHPEKDDRPSRSAEAYALRIDLSTQDSPNTHLDIATGKVTKKKCTNCVNGESNSVTPHPVSCPSCVSWSNWEGIK